MKFGGGVVSVVSLVELEETRSKWKSRVLVSKLSSLGELSNLQISFDIP